MTDEDVNPADLVSKVEKYTTYALDKLTVGLAVNGDAYVYVTGDPNPTALRLRTRAVKRMIRKWAHKNKHVLRNDEVNDIIENLYAHAAINDDGLKVYLRVGKNEAGFPEIDLGTEDRSRVQFKDGKATVVAMGSNTLFIRPESMQPLPVPAETGSWKPLLAFLNVAEEEQYLILAWITYVITHPRGEAPYPILVLRGQQGTGKSLLGRAIIRPLVDNNVAGIQLFPSDVKDIAISSAHQYMLVYDNVRSLTKRQSDDLCVLATGGSMSSRRLYTDDEEFMLQVHAAMVLNGIHNFVQESDLASRCITVTLQPLDYSTRRDEAEFTQVAQEKMPQMFRGVLDLAAQILQAETSAEVINPERLMNFSRWLAAMEKVIELPPGKLQTAYSNNLRQASLDNVQDNVLAVTLLRFMEKRKDGSWQGTATALLAELSKIAPANTVQRQSEWPQNPIALSKRLKQLEAMVKPQGITIDFSHGTQRIIEINYVPRDTSESIDGSDGIDDGSTSIAQKTQRANSDTIEIEVVHAPATEAPPPISIEVIEGSGTQDEESPDKTPKRHQDSQASELADENALPAESGPVPDLSPEPSPAVESATESDSTVDPGDEPSAVTFSDLEDTDMGGTANG